MTFKSFINDYFFGSGTSHAETVDGKNEITLIKDYEDKLTWYVKTDKYGDWCGSCYPNRLYTIGELYFRITKEKKELLEGEWEEYRTRAELVAEIKHLKTRIEELERQAKSRAKI